MLITSNWRDWYHFKHLEECWKSGTEFEVYVTKALRKFHVDFVNPAPSGTLGDGGCDGLANSGRILYACYGQRPLRNAERELAAKIESDFARAEDQWSGMETWRFVTNAPFGSESLKALSRIQREHDSGAERVISARYLSPQDLWDEVVGTFPQEILNELFPGAPGIDDLELQDVLPLLAALNEGDLEADDATAISPVPAHKMEFNSLSAVTRIEFNSGRVFAPRIDTWYASSDPDLYDVHGERFRTLYRDAIRVSNEPSGTVERLYVALAGPNMRVDPKRANAAFAVVAYFFDACHIFEIPPPGWTSSAGVGSVATSH